MKNAFMHIKLYFRRGKLFGGIFSSFNCLKINKSKVATSFLYMGDKEVKLLPVGISKHYRIMKCDAMRFLAGCGSRNYER